jgi:hypothetical protein
MLYELGEGEDGSQRGRYLRLKIRRVDARTGWMRQTSSLFRIRRNAAYVSNAIVEEREAEWGCP